MRCDVMRCDVMWCGILTDKNELNVARHSSYDVLRCLNFLLPYLILSYLFISYHISFFLISDVGSERHTGCILAPARRSARYVHLHARTYTCTANHSECMRVQLCGCIASRWSILFISHTRAHTRHSSDSSLYFLNTSKSVRVPRVDRHFIGRPPFHVQRV